MRATGQDDEATRKWEDYQQRNRLNARPRGAFSDAG